MTAYPLTPFPRSYWVLPGSLLAGFYPGSHDPIEAGAKLQALFDVGIRCTVNLMKPGERDRSGRPFTDYSAVFAEIAAEEAQAVSCLRFAVQDLGVPDVATMSQILETIDASIAVGMPVYVHCWGGIGRTGTVVGCYLIHRGLTDREAVIERIRQLREGVGAQWHRPSPETRAQMAFVESWPRHEKSFRQPFSSRVFVT